MRLRLRLALVFAAGTALLAVLGGAIFLQQLRSSLDDALDTALRARADTVLQALPDGGDGANFQDSGGDNGLLPPNQSPTQVLGMDGRVLEASQAVGTRPLLDRATLRQARRGPRTLDGTMPSSGEPLRLLAVPVPRPSGTWVVVVGAPLRPTAGVLARARAGVLATGAAAVVLAGTGAWLLAGFTLRPVERMRRTAAAISAHDTAAQVEVPPTRDEVAALAVTFNELLDRLRRALARQRSFVADASHELRSPLAVLRTELELARQPGRSRAELTAAVGGAAEETDRLVLLAEDLLFLARSDEGVPVVQAEPVALAATAPDDLVAEADPIRIRQAVDNLVDNALHWTPRGGRVDLTGSREGQYAVVTVTDSGPGFPTEFLSHAFERFRRADVARSNDSGGTGLGLAIVDAIVKAHGGWAAASNRPDGGASVRLGFPAQPGDAAPARSDGGARGA